MHVTGVRGVGIFYGLHYWRLRNSFSQRRVGKYTLKVRVVKIKIEIEYAKPSLLFLKIQCTFQIP